MLMASSGPGVYWWALIMGPLSTSHCWAIIIRSPPVGYTGCLLTLVAGARAGGGSPSSLLLPTHSLSSSRVVPAKATSTPTLDR